MAELAIKIKNSSSDRAVDRIYAVMLDSALAQRDADGVLKLLVQSADATKPSPATMRTLTRAVLDSPPTEMGIIPGRFADNALIRLFDISAYPHLIADELGDRISAMVRSTNLQTRIECLQLLLDIATTRISWRPYCHITDMICGRGHDREDFACVWHAKSSP